MGVALAGLVACADHVEASQGARGYRVLYFSDCQAGAAPSCVPGDNANPGTQAAPKRTLSGIDLNRLPAGTSMLFARGGAWNHTAWQRLENLDATPAAPLVFADHGSGALPLFRFASGQIAYEVGGGWNNQTNDGGYVFRNIKFDGGGMTKWAFWLRDNVHDVTFDGVEITGFEVAIHAQSVAPHGVNNINLLNSRIVRNSDMGWLGKVRTGLRIEGSTIEGNNFSGSGFSHGIYIGGGDDLVVRNNRFVRNSVGPNGQCSSGGLTMHGQFDRVLIEGNEFEQDAAAQACWQMSITAGYTTPEWFRNLVVRNNRVINGGNAGMVIQSAPGALIEGNRMWRTYTPTFLQYAIRVSGGEAGTGDDAGGGETIRNNTACFTTPWPRDAVVSASTAGTVQSGNAMRTGADASTAVCAR